MGSRSSQPRKRVGAVVTRSLNTQYTAATDGYVKAYDTNLGGEASRMQLLCDNNNPPTTVVDQWWNSDGNSLGGVSWLVAKGENWKVTWGYPGVVLWRPLAP